ncbi:hypothetical protein SALBM217S_03385 [Streptomyces griseoloalbus]
MGEIRAGAGGIARSGLVLKLLTGLKQICNHPAQFLKEEDAPLTGRSGKLELLDELLGTITAEGGAALVFTQYVTMARLLERHLRDRGTPAALLHGGTPVARREELVRRFQDGEFPVFLLSLKAAGTGLNLTRADHVVHYDRWWNPAVEAQATDRADRIGQARPVQVHRLIAEGTVEDRIAAHDLAWAEQGRPGRRSCCGDGTRWTKRPRAGAARRVGLGVRDRRRGRRRVGRRHGAPGPETRALRRHTLDHGPPRRPRPSTTPSGPQVPLDAVPGRLFKAGDAPYPTPTAPGRRSPSPAQVHDIDALAADRRVRHRHEVPGRRWPPR